MIKNLIIASLVATHYYGYVIEGVKLMPKIFATVAILVLMLILLRDADKYFLRESTIAFLKRREKRNEGKTS